ncbi:MAG: hypothetical protein IKA22_04380 [Lentisphaeria bacterium]|nr:hypothetical protein [Lentisphaeria bacterium]
MNKTISDDLLKEFEESGLDLDSFMKKKLSDAGKVNAVEIVEEMNTTAAMIDQNYADLKEHKANGGNRQSWLQRKLGVVFSKMSPSQAGQVIGHLTQALSGDSEDVPEDAVYNDINAESKIEKLDKAIIQSVCRNFVYDGGEK